LIVAAMAASATTGKTSSVLPVPFGVVTN